MLTASLKAAARNEVSRPQFFVIHKQAFGDLNNPPDRHSRQHVVEGFPPERVMLHRLARNDCIRSR
jgi:hypothetical protein